MTIESKGYALSIEHIVRKVFNCERSGFGGVADADAIETKAGMYIAMACSLATFYKDTSLKQKNKIDKFLDEYSYYCDKSIKDIIEENGKEEVEKIIEEFEELLK